MRPLFFRRVIPSLFLALPLLSAALFSGCDRFLNLTAEEHLQRAKDLQTQKNYKGSILELKNALQKDPNNAQIRWLLGEAYLKVGQGADAEKELKRAEELGISHESVQTQIVQALLLQGNYTQALKNSIPSDKASSRQKAMLLSMQGEAKLGLREPESGCPLFDSALSLDSQIVPAYRGRARCAMHAKNPDLARAQLQTAIKIAPEDIENWILLGDIELNQNQLSAAEKSYSKTLALQPENRSALLKHALVSLSMNQKERARKDLEVLRESAPKSADLLYLDAVFKYQEGKFQAALSAIQKLLGIQPDHPQTNLLAGLVLYEMKSYEQAITHLSKVVSRASGREARKYLASAQLLTGDAESAFKTLAPIALTTNDPQVLALLAEIQQSRGNMTQALASLRQANQLAPGNRVISTRLASLHFKTGDEELGFAELNALSGEKGQITSADIIAISELIKKKRYAQALAAADGLIQRAPNSALAYNLKGMAQAASGDIKGGYASFEQAHSIDPDAIAAILNLAQLDERANTVDKSIARLTRYVDQNPGHAQALITLAKLEASKGNRRAFLAWIDKALKANPAYIPAHALRVRDLIDSNQPGQALSAARAAVNAAPENPLAQALLADVQYASNDMVNAVASYTKLAQKSSTPRLLYRLASAQVAIGKRGEAIANLEKSRKLSPGDIETLALLSNLRIAEKNFAESKKLIDELKQRFPQSATGWYQEGQMFDAQGQSAQALEAYRQGHAIANDSRSVTYLHMALVRGGQVNAANGLLTAWLKQHPKDDGVRRHLAGFYAQSGQPREGIEQYLLILRQSPGDVQALNNLAILYQSIGDAKAMFYAEKAAKAAPKNPQIQDTLGWIQVQYGQLEKGISTLKTAYAAQPGNPEIALHLASALAKKGEVREARLIAKPASEKPSPQQSALRALLDKL